MASLFLLWPSVSFAELSGIAAGEVVSLEKCLEIARARQPIIRAAMGQEIASQSRVGQARAGYYPVVDLSAGYDIDGGSTSDRASGDSYSANISLFQNIYDFGRTSSQVRIREFDTTAFQADLQNAVSFTEFNTKQAYYRLIQSKRNIEVALEIIKQFESQLERARGFFDVGLRPKFDVTRAEVDLSNAKVNLIRAENAVRLSVASLKNAIGMPDAPDFDVKDDFDVKAAEISLAEASERALKGRGDLRASAARKQAVEESVGLAQRGYYPFVTGNAGYSWTGGDGRDDGFSAGIAVTLPLFSGFVTKHLVQESRANVTVAGASEDLVRQNVMFEVQQAFSNLIEAGERIPAAELALRQAEENLEIASGRYSTGVGSPIEVTDAAVVFVNAKTAHIQALTDYKIARASLERAMGETGVANDR